MKLIIDIDDDIRFAISQMGLLRISDEMQKKVDKAIQHGTPIPDNATNEDIINTMFDRDMAYNIRCYVKNYMLMGEWLDAPYQKGGTT